MTTQAIRQIERDFENNAGPFSDVVFPEERMLEELPHDTREGRATFVSMFATFDYNRDANQLVDNIVELHNTAPVWFDADEVATGSKEKLELMMEKIGFRYPSRDANGWHENCQIISEKYSGKWTEFLLSTGLDAPTLVDQLEEDDFLFMKGVKIAPMYARIVNDFVAPVSNLWQINIPVDTHVRRLSKDLFGDDLSDDEIRERWREIGEEHDVANQIVDGGLWHIGNKWDEWGEEYWNEVTA